MLMVLNENGMRQEILKIKDEIDHSNSINNDNEKYIRMMKITFKKRFDIGAMRFSVLEKIKCLLDDQDIELTTKSGSQFITLEDNDWAILTYSPVPFPNVEWFDEILARDYESEREVETYFIAPLLEKLGYNYEDIYINYPIEIPVGKKIDKVHADFAIFNGPSRDRNDVLLIIEAKSSNMDITSHHISQARSYARELFPAHYIVTNGRTIKVFSFNGMKNAQDSQVELC